MGEDLVDIRFNKLMTLKNYWYYRDFHFGFCYFDSILHPLKANGKEQAISKKEQNNVS